ncbi:hypothetical protein [Niallia sp. FSL M8-0099]|uniref:hypothetical protein n=1 Tax=Niallia sp. FSL M8-0099 TaxID=2954519 RepID=UPI0030F674FB
MNVVVKNENSSLQAGDVIEYNKAVNRKHPFYMICHSEKEGWFVMSLTGTKGRMKFYPSVIELINHQKDIKKVYSKQEWNVVISKL